MDSGVKVMEKGDRPSELTGKEEQLASLGLRDEEEMEALLQRKGGSEAMEVVCWATPVRLGGVTGRDRHLRLSSVAALLCRLSVSRSSMDEFHVLRLCGVKGVRV